MEEQSNLQGESTDAIEAIDTGADPDIAAAIEALGEESADGLQEQDQTEAAPEEQVEAEAEAEPETEDPAKAELDHAKARRRAEYLQRRAAKLERKEADIVAREQRVSSVERQLTSDNAADVFAAIAKMRGVTVEALIREGLGQIAGNKPTPEQEMQRLQRRIDELEGRRSQEQQAASQSQLQEQWEREVASNVSSYEYLAGDDPADVVEEAWAVAEREYRKAVRMYGDRARVPTGKEVLQYINDQRRSLAERFGKSKQAETPRPDGSAQAAIPRRGTPPTQRQVAKPPTVKTVLTDDDYLALAAAEL